MFDALEPFDLDQPTIEEPAVPAAWLTEPVACEALDEDCVCPDEDCPRDHENE